MMAGRVQFFSGKGNFGKIWHVKNRLAVVAAAAVLGLAAMVGCGGDAEPAEMEAPADESPGAIPPPGPWEEEGTVWGSATEFAPALPPPTTAPLATGESVPTSVAIPVALATIDAALSNTMQGSIAHNAPEAMVIDDLVEIELLISPSSEEGAPAQLAAEVSAPGPVVSSTLQVTPWMRAALESANPDAFHIRALHAEPAQLLSNVEPTAWRWTVQAREPGAQRLFVTVDRLVQVGDEDNWRTVETYRHDMQVNVTWPYRLSRMGAALRDNIIYPLVVTLLGGLVVWFVQQWRQGRSAREP